VDAGIAVSHKTAVFFRPKSPYSTILRNIWALMATMTVLMDIGKAPTAGGMMKPIGARTPATSGMATILQPAHI
jgi:hypothetical protein